MALAPSTRHTASRPAWLTRRVRELRIAAVSGLIVSGLLVWLLDETNLLAALSKGRSFDTYFATGGQAKGDLSSMTADPFLLALAVASALLLLLITASGLARKEA